MKVLTPSISWHDRQRVSSLDFQPRPEDDPNGPLRLATAGDDHHVVVRT